RPGSTHGYDVVDPTRLNDELGGAAAFEALSDVLDANGLRVLLDIVPNHMAADDANPWWRDVVEHRGDSAYAGYFDIDWEASGGAVVRRIVETGERLPHDWPVAGTTGYEFGTRVLGLLVDERAEKPLTDLYVELTGDERAWGDVALAGKLRAMEGGLAPDLD